MGVFHDGYAIVANYTNKENGDKVFGFVDKKGKLVLPIEYMDAIPFSEGFAYVMKEGKRGYISNKLDNSGNLIMSIKDELLPELLVFENLHLDFHFYEEVCNHLKNKGYLITKSNWNTICIQQNKTK